MSGKEKHVPLRMCVACREMKAQHELLRVVCKEGCIELDLEKRKFGRGAYVCRKKECVERAAKRNLLAKHFKQKVAKEVYDKISGCLEEE